MGMTLVETDISVKTEILFSNDQNSFDDNSQTHDASRKFFGRSRQHMDDRYKLNMTSFFSAISGWRCAYTHARLNVLAIRRSDCLAIVKARIYLDAVSLGPCKPHFVAGSIEAFQWDIPQSTQSIEDTLLALLSSGVSVEQLGCIKLQGDDNSGLYVAPPTVLHPEGISTGNRLAVMEILGMSSDGLFTQPETDWLLKSGSAPYDTLNELCLDYNLGASHIKRSSLEVVARTVVEMCRSTVVQGSLARLSLRMASNLDTTKAKIGYRVLDKSNVVRRGTAFGAEMSWTKDGNAATGSTQLDVPVGAVVHCIASYGSSAHHVYWCADPSIFQNPRAASFSLVDQGFQIMRGYLQPDLASKGKIADDFEAAVGWLLWILGFSTATFGTNAKTRDGPDTIAITPAGDFVVVECTLGLPRADTKLGKLNARVVQFRDTLHSSNMKGIRVLPVIVTAMNLDEVKADVAQVEELGVLILTRENIETALNDLIRFPDANGLFEQGMNAVQDRKQARIGVANP
jgi:hypothetical protein